MSINDQYSLNWNNHTNHIKKAFDTLWLGNQFVDVTLSCEGKKISAHKMLLSACSIYFHDLFRDNPCQHPIVILKDVKFHNLVNILKFIYSGEVSVPTETFDEFLKTAELLQISGLTDEETRTISEKTSDIVRPSYSSNKKLDDQKLVPISDKSVEPPKPKEQARKRLSEASSVNNVSQKKAKDNEIPIDVEIKQETVVEDDHFVDIKDPLDLEEDHNEPTDPDFMLAQPAGSQTFVDVQDVLNDKQSTKKSPVKEERKPFAGISIPAKSNVVGFANTSYPPLVITHVATHIPSTLKKQYPTRKCRYCPGRKETRWQCVQCGNIPLHRDNCFEIYHNKLLYN